MICPGINDFLAPQSWTTDQKHYALGSVQSLDVYFTDAGSVKHKAKIGLVLMRCLAAIDASAGVLGFPVALSYNATYGRGITDVYAAADLTSYFGLTASLAAHAAGDLMWVQFTGPSYRAVGGIGAIASLALVQHNAANRTVKTITDADNAFAKLAGVATGGDATIPAGDLWLLGKVNFALGGN